MADRQIADTDISSLGFLKAVPASDRSAMFRNFNGANTVRTALGFYNARNGIASHRIAIASDSTGTGVGSQAVNAFQNGWPNQLAARLKARDPKLDAMQNSRLGVGGAAETLGTNDSRWTVASGTGWAVGPGLSLGGGLITGTAAGQLNASTLEACDAFELYYVKITTAGSFSYGVNGGSTTTVTTTAGATSLEKITVPATLGTNVLNLNWVSGTVYIVGVIATDSTRKCVEIVNGGIRSSNTGSWTDVTNGYRPLPALQTVGAKTVLIGLGINDAGNTPYTLAVYLQNLQMMITTIRPYADPILVAQHRPQSSFYGGTFEGQYTYAQQFERMMQGVYALSASQNVPLIDLTARIHDYTVYQPLGAYADGAHLTRLGYGILAEVVASALLSL